MEKCVTNLSNEAVIRRYVDFCNVVDSDLSRSAISACKADEYHKLKDMIPDAELYSDAVTFAKDWQVYQYLRKFPGLPGTSKVQRRDAAIASWSAGETRCFRTNERLKALLSGDTHLLDSVLTLPDSDRVIGLAGVIALAQGKIESVLGPFNWKKVTSECRWSSGATVDQPRGTQLSKKMTEKMTVTKRALPYLRKLVRRDIHWTGAILNREVEGYCSVLDGCFDIVEHNRFLTVPKTAFTDRCIAAEPTGNTFLQQGVGRYIRGRLKRFGVDLDDQSWNQELARKAYLHGFSTIDLEGASDSVSFQLVKLLLPERWFDYLSDLRSPMSRMNTRKGFRKVLLQKFSSMGNAFTFELETLIFWSVASALSEMLGYDRTHVGVYGDDIVVKRSIAPAVIEVLSFLGFKVNSRKTYLDGNFFESCGANYFMGIDVTGFSQEDLVGSRPELFSYYNRHIRWSMRIFGTPFSKETRKAVIGLFDKKYSVPLSEEADFGMLGTRKDLEHLEFDPNRGYKCFGYAFVPGRETMYKQRAFYAYKLRRPMHTNADPKGRPLVVVHKDDGA